MVNSKTMDNTKKMDNDENVPVIRDRYVRFYIYVIMGLLIWVGFSFNVHWGNEAINQSKNGNDRRAEYIDRRDFIFQFTVIFSLLAILFAVWH